MFLAYHKFADRVGMMLFSSYTCPPSSSVSRPEFIMQLVFAVPASPSKNTTGRFSRRALRPSFEDRSRASLSRTILTVSESPRAPEEGKAPEAAAFCFEILR